MADDSDDGDKDERLFQRTERIQMSDEEEDGDVRPRRASLGDEPEGLLLL